MPLHRLRRRAAVPVPATSPGFELKGVVVGLARAHTQPRGGDDADFGAGRDAGVSSPSTAAFMKYAAKNRARSLTASCRISWNSSWWKAGLSLLQDYLETRGASISQEDEECTASLHAQAAKRARLEQAAG